MGQTYLVCTRRSEVFPYCLVDNLVSPLKRGRNESLGSHAWLCETRDHIYFACPYLTRSGGGLLQDQATRDWTETLETLMTGRRDRMDHILLSIQTTIYVLWRERNTRV